MEININDHYLLLVLLAPGFICAVAFTYLFRHLNADTMLNIFKQMGTNQLILLAFGSIFLGSLLDILRLVTIDPLISYFIHAPERLILIRYVQNDNLSVFQTVVHPAYSQYRLSANLFLAFIIIWMLALYHHWIALKSRRHFIILALLASLFFSTVKSGKKVIRLVKEFIESRE